MLGTMAKAASKPSALIDTRVIYCGDNLEQLRKLPAACVNLIYIDPPFNSNRNYEVFWGETKEKRAFEDRHASTQAYIEFMRSRCVELRRVLKKTGSFYYHCDDHASHYVKQMLDQIFGQNQFLNEIVWKRTGARSDAKRWNQLHDTLLVYTGGGEYVWNPQFEEYSEDYVATKYRFTAMTKPVKAICTTPPTRVNAIPRTASVSDTNAATMPKGVNSVPCFLSGDDLRIPSGNQ